MFLSLIAIVGGILASSSFLIYKKPDAEKYINKLIPLQGFVGIVLLTYGSWGLLSGISSISNMSGVIFLSLLLNILELIVGFLLSFGLISKYLLERNQRAKLRGRQLREKLSAYQVPAGLSLLILALLSLLF